MRPKPAKVIGMIPTAHATAFCFRDKLNEAIVGFLTWGGAWVPQKAAAQSPARRTRTLPREELIPFSAASVLKLRNH
jgi:hypothetical protein